MRPCTCRRRRPRSRPSASSRGTACRTPRPTRCSSGCTTSGCRGRRCAARRVGRVGHTVEEPPLVERAVRAALATSAVVGDDDHDRVVELSGLFEVVEHATDLVVGVRHEPGEHLGHACEQTLLVGVQRVPRAHGVEQWPRLAVGTGALGLTVRVDRRQLGVVGQQSRAPSGAPGSRPGSPRSPGRTRPCTCRPTPWARGAVRARTRARGT